MVRDSITCIVLNWNGGQDTMNCVRSLLASRGVEVDILVVDNGSSDGSDVLVMNGFSQVTLLKNGQNLGVAKAWNNGARHALQNGSGLIFFLNNDAVVDEECLVTLQQAMRASPEIAIVSPRILDATKSGRIWFDGGLLNMFGYPVHRYFSHAPRPDTELFVEQFATGCAMLVRSEVFDIVGFFDEAYFAYSEDADLCLRARANGFTIVHNPRALVTHYPSAATIKNEGKWFRDYYVTRNSFMFGRRHWSGMRRIMFYGYSVVIGFFTPVIYFALTGQLRRIGAVMLGVIDFVRGKDGKRYG